MATKHPPSQAPSPPPSPPSIQTKTEAAAASLCELLQSHLYLDGGACFATTLPLYDRRIQKSLSAQRTKLLNFLERYPTIFQCTRDIPHIVSLVNTGKVLQDSTTHSTNALSASNIEAVASTLENKALALLQSRTLKLQRRSANKKQAPDLGAPLNWLLKRLHTDLHLYLRLKRFYCNDANACLTGAHAGSPEWCVAASTELQTFIATRPTAFRVHVVSAVSGPDFLVSPLKLKEPKRAVPNLKQHNHLLVATDAEGMFSVTNGKSAKEMVLLVKKYYMELNLNVNGISCCSSTPSYFVDMTAGVGSIAVKSLRYFDRVDCYETDPTRYQLLLENVNNAKKRSSMHTLSSSNGTLRTEVKCYCEDSIAGMQLRNLAGPAACAILDPPWGGLRYDKSKEIYFNKKPLRAILEELAAGTAYPLVVGIKLPLRYDIKKYLLPQNNDDGTTCSKEEVNVPPTFVTLVYVKKIRKQLFAVFHLGNKE